MAAQSIMQTDKECYITGRSDNLECHHIYFGANRKISDNNGFWVWRTRDMHTGNNGIHGKYGQSLNLRLKMECQQEFEKTHSREDFIRLIGRSYL